MHFSVFLAAFTAAIFGKRVESAQIPICNQIHMIANLPRWWSDGAVVYNFSMDLSLTAVDDWNTMLTFTNFASWSADNNLYYQDKPLRYVTNGEAPNPYIYCPNMGGNCNITLFNAAGGTIQLPVHLDSYPSNGPEDYSPDTWLYTDFTFDSGSLYASVFGNFFDPQGMTCFTEYEETPGGTVIGEQYCCTNYIYVKIPDSLPSQCIQFQSNTTFSNPDGSVSSSFTAQYAYTSDGIEYSINPLQLSSNYPFYEFYPNRATGNWQNVSFPMTFMDPYVPYDGRDFQVDVSLSEKNAVFDGQYGGVTIAGRIISRNGVIMKNATNPYTPEDPCWEGNPPIFSGSKAKSTFCCTKFFTPPPSATPCAEYQTFTKVYKDEVYEGIYFNVKYQLNSTAMVLTIMDYKSPTNSTLQVEAYSTDLFTQTCRVSSSSPTKTCVFKLSATDQYTLQYRTSINPDSVNMTNIYVSSNQIMSPYLTPLKPCQAVYQFDMMDQYETDRAMTELCCIAQPGGAYPGGLSSFGYPYPFAQRNVKPTTSIGYSKINSYEKHIARNIKQN